MAFLLPNITSIRRHTLCLQFDHAEFHLFNQKLTGRGNKGNPLYALAAEGGKNKDEEEITKRKLAAFTEWASGWSENLDGKRERHFRGESFKLVEAIAKDSELQKAHAEVLFISLNNSDMAGSDDADLCNAFRRSVIESAWGQSYTLRNRSFRELNLRGYSGVSNPADAAYLPGIRATIEHLDSAVRAEIPFCARPKSVEKYPAITSFIERLGSASHPNLKNGKSFGISKLYFANTLVASDTPGCLTIEDYIKHYPANGNKTQLTGDNARGKGASRLAVVEHVKECAEAISQDPGFWPFNLAVCSETTASQPFVSAFRRMRVEVTSGLETLPVLRWLETLKLNGAKLDLSGTLILACQHLLRETCCWMHHLLKAGARVVIVGKDYSTNGPIAMRMRRLGMEMIETGNWTWEVGQYSAHLREKIKSAWKKTKELLDSDGNLNRLIVVDDGGFLLDSVPQLRAGLKIVGIEQTTSGLPALKKQAKKFPTVNVAGHNAKRTNESKMIADAIVESTDAHCPIFVDHQRSVGVLGKGAIGAALCGRLTKRGHRVFVTGRNDQTSLLAPTVSGITQVTTAAEVVKSACVIFGCAGEDLVTSKNTIRGAAGKWFVSCGSMDTEFSTLLKTSGAKKQREHNPFSTVTVPADSGFAYVLNGGFPINFERRWDSVPLRRIQLTRALMHAALLQAITLNEPSESPYSVDFIDGAQYEHLSTLLGVKLSEL